ncbi:FecR family protein [Zunongwangia profunda]|jgi:hypothetical protein|uniref:FecR family protein n=1 Tax=Zunongwangia profunda TaxID=398743 RepID=UPI001D190366|nr:FecR family protein [Zunongwangia profunda]MCC4226888.1 FecR family protein [Zunongwangia profunda]
MKKSEIEKKFDKYWKENSPEIPSTEKEKSWEKFSSNHLKHPYPKTSTFIKYAAAIAIMVILGTGFYILNRIHHPAQQIASVIHIENPGNKLKLIFLPDSSEIRLQSHSKITYSKDYSNNREVSLQGNAFFKVRKDKNHPFKVINNKTITTALGTSFTIAENEIQTRVKLHEGKVKMTVQGQSKNWILLPGEEFILEDGATKIQHFKNHVDFEKESVKNIISFLEQEYAFKIAVPEAFLSKQITLRIKKEEDIEIPLKILAEIHNLNYSIDRFNNTVIFRKQTSAPTNNIIKK